MERTPLLTSMSANSVSNESHIPFSTSTLFFHAFVIAIPIRDHPGMYTTPFQPRTPDGAECLIRLGHTIIMSPNHHITWNLEECREMGAYIRYAALSNQASTIRYLLVQKEWTSEGEEEY
jgi:hypothetical protein